MPPGPLRAAGFLKPPACADLSRNMSLRPGRAGGAEGKLAPRRAGASRQGWEERAELLAGELGVHDCSLPWPQALKCDCHPLSFTYVFFCPQGNDVRIILGQFDQTMAAKVFCCVSKTSVLSLCLTKLFLRLILTAWSERNIGPAEYRTNPESGLQEAEVLWSLLFPLCRELNPQGSGQCSHGRS